MLLSPGTRGKLALKQLQPVKQSSEVAHPDSIHGCSKKTAVPEVVPNDDVSDGIEDEFDVARVSRACKVGVNLLGVSASVQALKHALDVF